MNNQQFASRPTSARNCLFDEHQLARRARTTLAGADAGLLVTGDAWGRTDHVTVVQIVDDDGEPLIACDADGIVAHAAATRRLANLSLEPNPTFGVQLTLSGRLSTVNKPDLAPLGCSARGGVGATAFIALRIDRVSAACPHDRPRRTPDDRRDVPIALYANAEPDLFAANLPRVVRHLNERQAEQIRLLAAHAIGRPRAHLAAASVMSLTAEGAQLCWIDDSGAHRTTPNFPRPAPTLDALAGTLRACVNDAMENEAT
jgi:hypothetical protein